MATSFLVCPSRRRMLTDDRLDWILADVLGPDGPIDHHPEFAPQPPDRRVGNPPARIRTRHA
jgi:hypothetical protein